MAIILSAMKAKIRGMNVKSVRGQPGIAETAIRDKLHNGQRLGTPSQGAPFVIERIDNRGVVLLMGQKETQTPFNWKVLEGALDFLKQKGWVPIGSVYENAAASGTFDEYLKGHIQRATAGWVSSLFEAAGLVQIDRNRPSRVRAIRRRSSEAEIEDGFIPEPYFNGPGIEPIRPQPKASVCPSCFLTLPTSGICGSCD